MESNQLTGADMGTSKRAVEMTCAQAQVAPIQTSATSGELHPCEWCGACVACDCRLGIEQWLSGNASHQHAYCPQSVVTEAPAKAAAATPRKAIESSLHLTESVSLQKTVVLPSTPDGTGKTILEKVRQHSQDFAQSTEWAKLANGAPHQAAHAVVCNGKLGNDEACGSPESDQSTSGCRGSLDRDSESTRSAASPGVCPRVLDEASPSSNVGVAKSDLESKPQELTTQHKIAGSNACTQRKGGSRPDWWKEAHLPSIRALSAYSSAGNLLDVRVERHAQSQGLVGPAAPWHPRSSAKLYEQMGMCDRQKTYIAAWLNMGGASLVSMAEVTNPEKVLECVKSEDFLMRRLKLVPGLMQGKFSLPSPGPDMAETVGSFFGLQNVDCFQTDDSETGPAHVCIRVDLYSKWYLRMGMQAGCFRIGNVAELLLVDVVDHVVMAGFRLIVTPEFLALMK